MSCTKKNSLKEQVRNRYTEDIDHSKINQYLYRPFDNNYIYYDSNYVQRARERTIYHLKHENIGLILVRQAQAINTSEFNAVFITKSLTDTNVFRRGGPHIFPLYLYPKQLTNSGLLAKEPILNLRDEILSVFNNIVGINFNTGSADSSNSNPIQIIHYIYAVLHSLKYRNDYFDQLKIDYPRVPFPKNKKLFWQLSKIGDKLSKLHLLENITSEHFITSYPKEGNNVIDQVNFENNKVWINESQFFDNVQYVTWHFAIGGYQPAHKWLKDRKGRQLSYEDIMHYQKIIVALTETDRLMKEIDKINFI